jgi:uncharacterized damage-inducible protein DinB
MNAKEAIKSSLQSTQGMLANFIGDLSDADLLVRPVPNANHIAWQLGHLIDAEAGFFGNMLPGYVAPELPAGFAEQHGKGTAAVEPPKGFYTKQQYLDLFNKARAATIACVDKMSDADLDKPTPPKFTQFAPTLGALLLMTSTHTMMHAGQFTVLRRKLGKPILF